MEQHVTLEKAVGETPLSCVEAYRATRPDLTGVPMAYAGRLDPMASGKLLILLGDECKKQSDYHGLDKTYEFSVLFGITSDSFDVLGRLRTCSAPPLTKEALETLCTSLKGTIELPYPQFSAKTVAGKPLHMWTLEGTVDTITIPTKVSTIYSLSLIQLESVPRNKMVTVALSNINSIPTVTDPRKALGNDFRRTDVRADWGEVLNSTTLPEHYTIASFTCTASSGTYMRTLATIIAERLGTCGLAYSIHRTHIGMYNSTTDCFEKEY